MCPSCTRGSLPFRNASCVCHAVWTGTRTQRCCVCPSNWRCHTTTTAATAGTLSDSGRIRSGESKIVPTVPLIHTRPTVVWDRSPGARGINGTTSQTPAPYRALPLGGGGLRMLANVAVGTWQGPFFFHVSQPFASRARAHPETTSLCVYPYTLDSRRGNLCEESTSEREAEVDFMDVHDSNRRDD